MRPLAQPTPQLKQTTTTRQQPMRFLASAPGMLGAVSRDSNPVPVNAEDSTDLPPRLLTTIQGEEGTYEPCPCQPGGLMQIYHLAS